MTGQTPFNMYGTSSMQVPVGVNHYVETLTEWDKVADYRVVQISPGVLCTRKKVDAVKLLSDFSEHPMIQVVSEKPEVSCLTSSPVAAEPNVSVCDTMESTSVDIEIQGLGEIVLSPSAEDQMNEMLKEFFDDAEVLPKASSTGCFVDCEWLDDKWPLGPLDLDDKNSMLLHDAFSVSVARQEEVVTEKKQYTLMDPVPVAEPCIPIFVDTVPPEVNVVDFITNFKEEEIPSKPAPKRRGRPPKDSAVKYTPKRIKKEMNVSSDVFEGHPVSFLSLDTPPRKAKLKCEQKLQASTSDEDFASVSDDEYSPPEPVSRKRRLTVESSTSESCSSVDVEVKRKKNNAASKKSRDKKKEAQMQLEEECERLALRNTSLSEKAEDLDKAVQKVILLLSARHQ